MRDIASTPGRAGWPLALLAWALAAAAVAATEGRLDLANRAMLLVAASALCTVWLPLAASLASGALAVLAFDWFCVPPRYTLAVSVHQHVVLLLAMLAVNAVVATVVARQRLAAARALRYGEHLLQLQRLGDALRDADEPARQAGLLQQTLADLLGAPVHLLVLQRELPPTDDLQHAVLLGQPDAHALAGLWQCTRQARPLGPGTGRHEELPEWYFPLRAGGRAHGAAMLRFGEHQLPPPAELRLQAQALCDHMGQTLQRAAAQQQAAAARDEAQLQGVRNALLAAISHDYRTPLATVLGAASSLRDQGDRLSVPQRERLLGTIVHEAEQLARLTDNTLQLARLDAPGVALQLDWESPEELVGALQARLRAPGRAAGPAQRLRVRLEPGLPLLRCDALLLLQLLENLVDNALKYSDGPVELLVRRQPPAWLVFAVRDRGPGVAPAWRERIFEVFQRGQPRPVHAAPVRSGGVGLAVCRAIARAHGGELKLRPRGHGGSSFECWLAEQAAPQAAREVAA